MTRVQLPDDLRLENAPSLGFSLTFQSFHSSSFLSTPVGYTSLPWIVRIGRVRNGQERGKTDMARILLPLDQDGSCKE